ncbi:hypothetical protein TNCT_398431 [Trichonephila clavata]|uniref:Uncharacterized protein n=1 Tax=Trichonephila clavata TaxID=2740835 RepID=A0A8X6HYM0_TRICU|nr:hypothetical protein TNCT_398431 [Trichonephila clavata]
MGRRGSIEWPPRSMDLIPRHLFFRGVVKNKVYFRKPVTVRELKSFIDAAVMEIRYNQKLYRTVCESVRDRLKEYTDAKGEHFEHLRD